MAFLEWDFTIKYSSNSPDKTFSQSDLSSYKTDSKIERLHSWVPIAIKWCLTLFLWKNCERLLGGF